MAQSNELSQSAHDRLSAELEDLTTRGRVEMAEKIKDVREVVDSADGGDYNATKEAKEQMEARIEFLSHTLDRAVIVEAPHDGSVGVGSLVEICYQGDDSTSTYLFGSIEERNHNQTLCGSS